MVDEGGGMEMSTNVTVTSQTGYVAMGTGGFYYAQFDNFAITSGKPFKFCKMPVL